MTKTDRKTEPAGRGGKRPGAADQSFLSGISKFQRSILLVLLAFSLTFIIVPKGGLVPDHYVPGDIAARDIKAPRDLLIPDLPLTETKRDEAEAGILPLYDFDPRTGKETAERLMAALEKLHLGLNRGAAPEILRSEMEQTIGAELTDAEFQGLTKLPLMKPQPVPAQGDANKHEETVLVFDSKFKSELQKGIGLVLQRMMVGNLQLFQPDRQRGVVVRNLVDRKEDLLANPGEVLGLGEGLDQVREQLAKVEGLSKPQRELLFSVVQKLIRPNLTFNKDETEIRKKAARESIKPVLFQVKKGEMIVRVGERVTPDQIIKLKALRELGDDFQTLRHGIGLFLIILVLLATAHGFAERNIRKYYPTNRDLWFLGTTLVSLFVLIKVLIFVSNAMEGALPAIDSTSYYYVFPFAVGAMLVRVVLNSEIAFVFALITSLLIGVLFGNSLAIAGYALVSSLVGAHWVRQCKERSTLYFAGLRLSLVNLLVILGIHLMAGRGIDVQLLYKLGFGLGAGMVCAVIVNGTIPLAEFLFKYTTDIKLLELANLNKPLLRELMVRAPGTYHHSIIVGNLAEAAAEEINANPLLARVAAYYHDIGKVKKPLYFVENSGDRENRHDKLAPSMSALILMAHMKDGVELARDHRIGSPLIDIIRQHHGTALIKFFFDKAKGQEKTGVQQVDERDYRYPGPKPQTREAALIMLADAVDAASRTLPDPTPARIQGMVQKLINNIFIDGQLDECELTLKDLHKIAKSFNRILAGMFHHRVDYPEPAYKERDKESGKRKNGADSNRESPKETKDRTPAAASGSTEDLKRLGMS